LGTTGQLWRVTPQNIQEMPKMPRVWQYFENQARDIASNELSMAICLVGN